MTEERSFSAVRPARAYAGISVLCLLGIPLVWLLQQPRSPVVPTIGALIIEAGVFLLLAATAHLEDSRAMQIVRGLGLFAAAFLAALPGWFFGPPGIFSALVALLAALAGLLTGAAPGPHPVLAGWMAYLGLALGQLTIHMLVLFGVLEDVSLAPVMVGGYPLWQYPMWHFALQGTIFGAFFAGRVFQKRYRTLAEQLEASVRIQVTKRALIDQARADYLRALVVGRAAAAAEREAVARGLVPARAPRPVRPFRREGDTTEIEASLSQIEAIAFSDAADPPTKDLTPAFPHTPSITPYVSSPAPAQPAPTPAGAPAPLAPDEDTLWIEAYRAKMRRQHAVAIGLCLLGIVLFGGFGRHRDAAVFAIVCMAGIIGATLLHRHLSEQRAGAQVYWPWVIVAALSIGPSFACGLHSAFGGVIASLLFFGELFRASHRRAVKTQRVWALVAVCVTQLIAWVLVFTHVVPDHGLVLVLAPDGNPVPSIVGEVFTQGVMIGAFVAGIVVDRRYEALTHQAEAAQQEIARQEALLLATTAQIDRVLAEEGEGLFAGLELGRFRLQRLRARGGMGDIYEADDLEKNTRVAVKLLRHDRAADARMLNLFAREAKLLARVESPYVARVFDVGGLEADLPYLAMELIEGSSLSAILRTRGRLDLADLRAMIRDVAAGLGAIHEAGIVHRDVKPPNIMLAEGGERAVWKLVDLGAAQVREPVGPTGESVVGTPTYMAPEQARGEAVDGRADLYGLCCVVYGALTGRPAFTGRETFALGDATPARVPPPPGYFVLVSRDLEMVLRIGLAVQPADRFATAAELADAFEQAFEGNLHPALRMRGMQLLDREPWTQPSGERAT